MMAAIDFCFYCEKQFGVAAPPTHRVRRRTIDHIHPISKGGRISSKRNQVWCCQSCNQMKADLTLEEFELKLLQKISTLDPFLYLFQHYTTMLKNVKKLQKLLSKGRHHLHYQCDLDKETCLEYITFRGLSTQLIMEILRKIWWNNLKKNQHEQKRNDQQNDPAHAGKKN